MNYISETKASRIASTLEEMILDNRLKSGAFLPSQQVLADQFKTSSRPIREALKLLEAKGLVTITQGRRAQIKSNSLNQYVESISTTIINKQTNPGKLLRNLMQVRITIATSATRDFSRIETKDLHLAKLWRSANQMESALPLIYQKDAQGLKQFQDAENEFNRTLISANDNQILSSIYENLAPLLDSALLSLHFSASQLEKRAKNYSYLCEALQNGQPDLAVALVLVTLTTLQNKVNDKFPDESAVAYA
ncbi:transcriptional regulator [Sphaerochaeta pleomorpha str. Grapes]|uniref:Transcriptional regulator n=1 Tax=Sphaerochaeta pleomorpha (strain ATCC BAA-1885 / DSM 22778 / Grapes) TaxID=158190 RepID=G8QQD9_SPHPG|nr:GntR family transcriptional regulator [Sphaerochaeta pleomorpha]AEV29784.1 transcriptional regulator [Sphaerochaeta pleomorpha str. Grapes]